MVRYDLGRLAAPVVRLVTRQVQTTNTCEYQEEFLIADVPAAAREARGRLV